MHGGRIERRVLRASIELTGYTDWPGLAQALYMERRVTHKATGETHSEVAYAVTSLAPAVATPAQLLMLWREQSLRRPTRARPCRHRPHSSTLNKP